jgi:hypothetical protein
MIKFHNQTLRTFFHSVAVAAAIALGLVTTGHKTLSAGFCIGAAISLFSLFSLKVCIPALFYKGANRQAAALLQVVLLMKLPIYALGLYFAARMGNAAAAAAFVGCTVVPGVITAEAVCKALIQANPRWRRAAAMASAPAALPAKENSARPAVEINAAVCDTAVATRGRTLHEGAA